MVEGALDEKSDLWVARLTVTFVSASGQDFPVVQPAVSGATFSSSINQAINGFELWCWNRLVCFQKANMLPCARPVFISRDRSAHLIFPFPSMSLENEAVLVVAPRNGNHGG